MYSNQYDSAATQLTVWQYVLKWLRVIPRRRYRQLRAWFRQFNSTTGRKWRSIARIKSREATETASERLEEFEVAGRNWYEQNRPRAEQAARQARAWTVRRWWQLVTGTKFALSIIVSAIFFGMIAGLIFFIFLRSDEADAAQLTCESCSLVSVIRVIDGDTLDTDAGRVRLYGIDTPEREEPCYDEATLEMQRLASSHVRLEAGPRLMDDNDRNLRYLYTEAGASIDELMIAKGLAEAWTRDGQHREHLMQIQGVAMQERTGCLWR